jgi:uncharacterized membrane protein YgcG
MNYGEIKKNVPVWGNIIEPKDLDLKDGDLSTDDDTMYILAQYDAIACPDKTARVSEKYQMSIQVMVPLKLTDQFYAHLYPRCCANVEISTDTRDRLCGDKYSGDDKDEACADLMGRYCNATSPTGDDPICGCFQYYVQRNVVDKDPSLKKLITAPLPPQCSKSCSQGVAWMPPDLKGCDLVICNTLIDNKGTIKAGKLNLDQQCGSSQSGSSGSGGGGSSHSGSDGGGGGGGGSGDGDDDGGGSGDGDDDGSNRKTIIIVASVVGGLLLLMGLMIILFLLF